MFQTSVDKELSNLRVQVYNSQDNFSTVLLNMKSLERVLQTVADLLALPIIVDFIQANAIPKSLINPIPRCRPALVSRGSFS